MEDNREKINELIANKANDEYDRNWWLIYNLGSEDFEEGRWMIEADTEKEAIDIATDYLVSLPPFIRERVTLWTLLYAEPGDDDNPSWTGWWGDEDYWCDILKMSENK